MSKGSRLLAVLVALVVTGFGVLWFSLTQVGEITKPVADVVTKNTSAGAESVPPVVPENRVEAIVPAEIKAPADVVSRETATEIPAVSEAEATKIRQLYGSNLSHAEKIKLLDRLSNISDPDGLRDAEAVLRLAMLDPDPAIRRMALVAMAHNPLLAALKLGDLVSVGLGDVDPEVVSAALHLLKTRGPEFYPEAILAALSSSNSNIVQAAYGMLAVKDTTVSLKAYEMALQAPDPLMRTEVMQLLVAQQDARGIPLLINQLRDPDPDVKAKAQHALFFFFDQNFDSYEAANAFWAANSQRFSGNIFQSLSGERESKGIASSVRKALESGVGLRVDPAEVQRLEAEAKKAQEQVPAPTTDDMFGVQAGASTVTVPATNLASPAIATPAIDDIFGVPVSDPSSTAPPL